MMIALSLSILFLTACGSKEDSAEESTECVAYTLSGSLDHDECLEVARETAGLNQNGNIDGWPNCDICTYIAVNWEEKEAPVWETCSVGMSAMGEYDYTYSGNYDCTSTCPEE